ncbi:hypothetical protein LINPERPRIM_LOCUS6185 [Linum perenne]
MRKRIGSKETVFFFFLVPQICYRYEQELQLLVNQMGTSNQVSQGRYLSVEDFRLWRLPLLFDKDFCLCLVWRAPSMLPTLLLFILCSCPSRLLESSVIVSCD